MRFWSWPHGPHALPTVLVLLSVLGRAEARERHYYIAAVEIDWTYSSEDSLRSGPTYKKVVFREFEEGFRQRKTHPSWLGLLGPTLRATEGDTIVVTFRNMANGAFSIHPHGVAYGKQSEGAHYFDNTSQKEKEDDIVQPNNEHVYYWEVTSDVSPQPDDPTCLTYTYISHQNVVEDYNSGLIGTLLICKPESLDTDGKQMGLPHEYVFLFGVFDEKESRYKPKHHDVDNHVKYTINGYTRGSLPDISVCANAAVSLHLMAMSSQPEVFSLHVNGQVLEHNDHKVSSLGLISGSTATAGMVAVHTGRWLLSSRTSTHVQAGMYGFVDVKMCDSFQPPRRRMTIAQRRESREWKYFIAAEEVIWDYAPNLQDYTDEDFKDQYLKQSPTRIGQKYKKAVYTLYKNENFTERLETKQRKNELGILGPVIRAQIRDVVTIVFKNMASRPYSIYPHGLTIQKSEEGDNYPQGGNQTHGVQPGETHTYIWKVVEEDEPLAGDPRCLTRMYHSAVDTPRDIASGLIGPLLICKSQSLNARNVQLRADKEQHAVFAVFDENKSWYLQDNINQFADPTKVTHADPNFYKSNVMHTINGYTFESGPALGFCNGEVATWHVSSIGAQDYIQTATFYGHPFELNERTEDFLSLYPMTGETISMNMDNIGFWLLASLNSHETTKGMRVKFQDVECYRDYEYEYSDKEDLDEFHMWDLPDLSVIKKEEVTPKPKKATNDEPDAYTDMLAAELGLRSLKNQSTFSDMEMLDLSFLEYDAIDIPDGNSNIMLVDEVTKTKNKTVFSNLKKMDEVNLTAVSNSSNSTHVQKTNTTSVQTNSSIPKTETKEEPDAYTDMLAVELGLGSLKNQSTFSDMEMLDLSFLEYDAIDIPDGNSNIMLVDEVTKTKNKTVFSNLKKLDEVNLTAVSNSSNSTHVQKTNTTSVQTNSSIPKTETKEEPDAYTDMLAVELGLGSLKNQSTFSDMEMLDLSFLEYDAIDIPDGNSNITLVDDVTKTKNKTVFSNLKKMDEVNLTAVSNSSNSTHVQKTSTTPVQTNSSIPKTENTTDFKGQASSDKNDNMDTNCCDFQVRSKGKDLSDKTSETVHNATEIPSALNRSSEMTNDTEPLKEPLLLKLINFVLSTFQAPQMPSEVFPVNDTREQQGSLNVSLTSQEMGDNYENISLTNDNITSTNISSNLETNRTDDTLKTFNGHSLEKDLGKIIAENLTEISLENITGLSGDLILRENLSNQTMEHYNLTVSSASESSEELGASESSEEVFIFLKENTTQAIKTTAIKTPGQNWTYEGTHQKVEIELPDHMVKYFKPDVTQTTAAPKKKTKKMTLRQRPAKGEGMKTRKKKVYKPVARTGLPFSPRGFHPGMTPRGVRPNIQQPVSDEEVLINKPVVVGIPRPDFSDYELYIPGDEPDHLGLEETDLKANEYEYVTYKDPYSSHEDIKNFYQDDTTKYYLKFTGPNVKTYFISAEEVEWDYTGYGHKRMDKMQHNTQKTSFTKVVFRGYTDSSFTVPDIRGEVEEHLGILGPVIKAEVGQSIMVVFRNNANRQYSIHPNGVTYTKQTEGLSYEDGSKYWYKYDNEVQPNTTFTYLWKVDSRVGPSSHESDCRTWAYYSGVNPEKDIHTGLIGPLLVCREGTLSRNSSDENEFVLLFMTFDESQSWYYQKNIEMMQRKSRRRMMMKQPHFDGIVKFHTINGIIFNLKGLRMYTGQLVRWHLINMGSPKDFQSVYFHGQTFIHKKTTSYRQAVFPLLPGSFATLEMYPSKPGLWQLETEVGFNQQEGMQTLFLVLDKDCYRPLGLESGSVKNNQITGNNTRGYWEPHLARLNNQGKYNAWSTEQNGSWIQVDFQRPVVISQVATQGAKQMLYSQYVKKFLISYSTDRRKWIFYKGGSRDLRKVFTGNKEAYETKHNTFFPPMIGRFIRLYPIEWYGKATVRMEFYGCELDGCSVPLGMESGLIENRRITASSVGSHWYYGPWAPSLARLNRQGAVNAWQAQRSDVKQWLQVELPHIKKITGIITQGAKTMGTEMYVTSYTLQYSDNGMHWKDYTDDEDYPYKTFPGNTNNNDHVKNYIYPPIFSRFIRILPKTWMNSITMRVELLGCDFE
ncbi:coagulation factor V isoform X2 [Cynoglossus semilaevis]|uniref:ferroxidase n=1 Tax=Cynoglossus semilaevis TaxID=244447 RepID=A0A3P8UMK3_CYNSE|nr:coagulation factor V isoform X2 [Cynoglossus semilaevis]